MTKESHTKRQSSEAWRSKPPIDLQEAYLLLETVSSLKCKYVVILPQHHLAAGKLKSGTI